MAKQQPQESMSTANIKPSAPAPVAEVERPPTVVGNPAVWETVQEVIDYSAGVASKTSAMSIGPSRVVLREQLSNRQRNGEWISSVSIVEIDRCRLLHNSSGHVEVRGS